jgi:hypothetical protein
MLSLWNLNAEVGMVMLVQDDLIVSQIQVERFPNSMGKVMELLVVLMGLNQLSLPIRKAF